MRGGGGGDIVGFVRLLIGEDPISGILSRQKSRLELFSSSIHFITK